MFKYENPNRLYEVDYDCKRASERLDLFFRKRIDNDYYSDVNGGRKSDQYLSRRLWYYKTV